MSVEFGWLDLADPLEDAPHSCNGFLALSILQPFVFFLWCIRSLKASSLISML